MFEPVDGALLDDPYEHSTAKVSRVTTDNHPVDRLPEGQDAPEEDIDGTRRMDDETRGTWKRLMGHYVHELDVQSENRIQMEEDEAFYDGDQWSDMDAAILTQRGQVPIVYNVICTALNWVFGTERRTRTDYKVLPRRKEGAQAAEKKSQLLKYISDVNRSEFSVSRAFQDCARAGVGWLEGGIQEEDEGEPVYDRAESWRNMLWDSNSIEPDLSDARYLFRSKWADLDVARAYFPDKAEVMDDAAQQRNELGSFLDTLGDEAMDEIEDFTTADGSTRSDMHSPERDRVRLIECWYRKPVVAGRVKGGDFSGEIFDPSSNGHINDVIMGRATIRQATVLRMHVMVMTSVGAVYHSVSPYRHNKFPFTPIWAYRKGSNNMPYGMVRNLKRMQEDINKRASKALWLMSTNRTIMDEGAVDDLEEYLEEVARPDAVIVKKQGKELNIDSDRGMDAAHLDMMSRTISMIQQTSGVTDENLGRQTNAASGRAITARQDQGSLATSILFDNLRFARQVHGEKMLSVSEQFTTEQKVFRITNKRGQPSFVQINDGLPENDIIATKADFIISEDSWDASLRQAKAEELKEMVQQLGPVAPEIVMAILDLLVETMDVPNSEEIVKRIRQFTGMMDPDVDLENPDDETARMLEAQAAKAEKAARMEDAEIAIREGEAAERKAKASKTTIETEKLLAALPGETIDAKMRALELALQMLAARGAVATADAVYAGASMPPAAPPQPVAAPPQGAMEPEAQPQPAPIA